MSGLDRIIENIARDADARCAAIASEASAKAAEIIDAAKAQAKQESDRLLKETAAKIAAQKSNAEAEALLNQRNSLIAAKLNIMDEIIAQAKNELDNLPTDEYFNVLLALAGRYSHDRQGEMFLGGRDLARMPADFEQRVNTSPGVRGSIRVSSEPRAIKNGFVLVYGDTEENCTFDALFESQKDALRDKLHAILF